MKQHTSLKPSRPLRTALILLIAAAASVATAQETSSSKLVFNHLALSVKDVDASAEFYGHVLGLPEITNRARTKGVRWFSLGEGKELHLISREYYEGDRVTINKAVHLALATSDLAAVLKLLDSHHVAYGDWKGTLRQVDTRSDGVRQVFLQDPDGYWLEINSAGEKR